MSDKNPLLRVAVPSPLRRSFDYLPPKSRPADTIPLGSRVLVPFGRQQQVGIVLGVVTDSRVSVEKLKRVKKVLDASPVFGAGLLKLLQWASHYYQHPVGEVFSTALPALLRSDQPVRVQAKKWWCLTEAGRPPGHP